MEQNYDQLKTKLNNEIYKLDLNTLSSEIDKMGFPVKIRKLLKAYINEHPKKLPKQIKPYTTKNFFFSTSRCPNVEKINSENIRKLVKDVMDSKIIESDSVLFLEKYGCKYISKLGQLPYNSLYEYLNETSLLKPTGLESTAQLKLPNAKAELDAVVKETTWIMDQGWRGRWIPWEPNTNQDAAQQLEKDQTNIFKDLMALFRFASVSLNPAQTIEKTYKTDELAKLKEKLTNKYEWKSIRWLPCGEIIWESLLELKRYTKRVLDELNGTDDD